MEIVVIKDWVIVFLLLGIFELVSGEMMILRMVSEKYFYLMIFFEIGDVF